MLELIKQRRLKDKFKTEFGATIEEFFDEQMTEAKQNVEAAAKDNKEGGETTSANSETQE